MHYLTNYYKNLCEQLQEKVDHLEQLLEYRKRSIVHLDVSDVDPYTGEDVPRIMGREVTKKGNPLGKGARKEKIFSTYPGMGAIRNMGNDQDALAWEIVSNSGRPTVQDNPIYASMLGKGPALEVGSGEVFHNRSDMRRKGRSEPGMGKKAKKKKLAIALAKIRDQDKNVSESVNDIANSMLYEMEMAQVNPAFAPFGGPPGGGFGGNPPPAPPATPPQVPQDPGFFDYDGDGYEDPRPSSKPPERLPKQSKEEYLRQLEEWRNKLDAYQRWQKRVQQYIDWRRKNRQKP